MKYIFTFVISLTLYSQNLISQVNNGPWILIKDSLRLEYSNKANLILSKWNNNQSDTIAIFNTKQFKTIDDSLISFKDSLHSYYNPINIDLSILEKFNIFYWNKIDKNKFFNIDTLRILNTGDSIFFFSTNTNSEFIFSKSDTTLDGIKSILRKFDDITKSELNSILTKNLKGISAIIDRTIFEKLLEPLILILLSILFILLFILFLLIKKIISLKKTINIAKKKEDDQDLKIESLNQALSDKFPKYKELINLFGVKKNLPSNDIESIFSEIIEKTKKLETDLKSLDKLRNEDQKQIEIIEKNNKALSINNEKQNMILKLNNQEIENLQYELSEKIKIISRKDTEIEKFEEDQEKIKQETRAEIEEISRKITQIMEKELSVKLGDNVLDDTKAQPILLKELLKVAILSNSYFKIQIGKYTDEDKINEAILRGNEPFQLKNVVDENSSKNSVDPLAYHLYKIIQHFGISNLGKVNFNGFKIGR